MQAVRLIQQGWSARKVGRYLGFHHTAVMKWVRKASLMPRQKHTIPTQSSRPKSHPLALDQNIVQAIIDERAKHHRCAEVVHATLKQKGTEVSLSSVKRTLERHNLLNKRSPWKHRHDSTSRPEAVKPGSLVEVDTIHIWLPERFYVYTLLDVYSRWAYALVSLHINTRNTLRFVRLAQSVSPFSFKMLQSDHGQEFGNGFTQRIGAPHRHTRVRTPNDNAHLERFNRTLQDECLRYIQPKPQRYQKAITEYLDYYNNERLHLSLNFKTPREWCQGID